MKDQVALKFIGEIKIIISTNGGYLLGQPKLYFARHVLHDQEYNAASSVK
jgi:hypothetical protein